MFGLLNSASAISAALRIAWPATPALPGAVKGRIKAALTWPVPMVAPCGAWALCCAAGGGVEEKYWELPEQPANSVPAVASKPAIERRRVGKCRVRLPADAGLSTCADTAALPTAQLRKQAQAPVPFKATAMGHIGGEWLTK